MKYGIKVDVWSLGMVYHEMMFGYLPKLGNFISPLKDKLNLELDGLSD
jgi:serine/threonine protein kinase